MDELICIENLHKTIGRQHILHGVNLSVNRGETLVIIGQSGGGKSVLLKHIIRLIQPDEGRILFEGEDIVPLPERQLEPIRKKIGILFQSAALFDSMTVAANVAFPLVEGGTRDKELISQRVKEVLDLVGLSGHEHKPPVALSGGMKKRVGLARAIINRPVCVLYDEPTAGLDPIVADSINFLIRRLQMRFHVTSIVVTHDMPSVFAIADRVAYLAGGKIQFYGTPEELRDSEDTEIQDFIHGRSHEVL